MNATTARRFPWRTLLWTLAGTAGLGLLLLVFQGAFHRKVGPGAEPPSRPEPAPAGRTATVLRREIEEVLEWPGTVRSRREARVASKLMARILEVRVDAGSLVKAGDVIAVLDDRDVAARLSQARAALAAAEAQAVQADAELARVGALFEKEAATRRDLEGAEARARSGRAQAEQARQAVAEAEILLSEAVVRAPFDGVVTDKAAQAGDTAVPGRPLATVQDPASLRLEAPVPGSCAQKAALGQPVRVRIDGLDRETAGRIEEIAPVADPDSRTFLLKAGLAPGGGLRPGMFGRFLQPCGTRTALLAPAAAVARIGQVETVHVLEDGVPGARHVRTGKARGDLVEILSGLREGETVLLPGSAP